MWYDRVKEDNTYKRDLAKRIELINWVLENMKNPDTHTQICALIDQVKNNSIIVIILECIMFLKGIEADV